MIFPIRTVNVHVYDEPREGTVFLAGIGNADTKGLAQEDRDALIQYATNNTLARDIAFSYTYERDPQG